MITDRLTDRRVVDPALRASLVIEAALAAALDAPTAVRTVLATAAAVAVIGSAVRRRARGRLDAVVVGLAGTVAVLVLLGLLLNLFPAGLTRVAWGIGAGVVGLAAVAWGARHTPTDDVPAVSAASLLRQGPWVLAAGGVTAVAVVVAVHATDVANRPPAQLSVTSASASSVAVHVTGGRASTGNYQIVVLRGGTELNRSEPFALPAGRSVDYRFTPVGARLTVDLRKVGTSTATRSLVVEPGLR